MSTTSLKISEDLKQLAAAAAKQQGITPHAFMVEAIRAAATAAEQRAVFVAEAVAAKAAFEQSGKGYDASQVHAYIKQRARGGKTARPKARTWRA